MLVVGLTGSVAMGKSTVAAMFAEAGVPVFDADETVHRLYAGTAAPIIEAAFPGTTTDGVVDRDALRADVLGNAGAMARLEALVHPQVEAERNRFIDAHKKAGTPMVLLDIPLLFEVGADRDVDIVVVVTASSEIQMTRLLARPGMTAPRAEAMRARQTPDAEKRRRAHFVVDTGGAMDATRRQVADLRKALAGMAVGR